MQLLSQKTLPEGTKHHAILAPYDQIGGKKAEYKPDNVSFEYGDPPVHGHA
jgi:hypothetical protein